MTVDTTSDVSDGDTTSISTLVANKGADGFVSLREAIIAARRITSHGARVRQRLYIGKLLRTIDPQPIREAMASRAEECVHSLKWPAARSARRQPVPNETQPRETNPACAIPIAFLREMR